ncbi:MAG TPA: DUF4331 family protein [Anaerolineae bacterium]
MRKLITMAALCLAAITLLVGAAATQTRAADHLDAPLVRADGRLDITDIYAFTQGDNTVLVMNVNPLSGILNTSAKTFSPEALYQFKIDNTGDAKANIAYRLSFEEPEKNGKQKVTLSVVTGNNAENDTGKGQDIAEGQTLEPEVHTIPVKGGGRLFAGLRDDPFFFDLAAFTQFQHDGNPADFCHPGVDFFKGTNITSIVLSVPTETLLGSSGSIIRIWGTVNLPDGHGGWKQVERMGKPALATVFIKPTGGANSDAYNATKPVDDLSKWGSFFPNNPIPLLGGITVRNLLLPDVLILNTAGPLVLNKIPFAGYPNGRRLQDDVIDTSFAVLANAGVLPSNVTSDCVNSNDAAFLTQFPFLAPPH